MTDKELYQQKMQVQLDAWKAEVDKLKARASGLSAAAQLEMNKQIETLDSKIDDGKAKLSELTEAGDLYLEVQLRDHSLYRVDGADIYLDLPVAPWQAALGAGIKAPTPAGAVDLKIPADSNQGRKLRLKGRGLPGKAPGDLYVVLQVTLPPADSEDAKHLYEQMQDQLGFNPRATMGVA